MSVKVRYNGSVITTVESTDTKVLKTNGKLCESDFTLFNSSGHDLPSTYQEVEYLQATGTQAILSNVYGKWHIIAKFTLSSWTNGEYPTLFGSELSSGSSSQKGNNIRTVNSDESSTVGVLNIGYSASKYNYLYRTTDYINTDIVVKATTYPTNGSYYIINNITYPLSGLTRGTVISNASNNAILGRYDQLIDALASDSYWKGKLYYLKCYESDGTTLIRDFIPCYRKSDSVAGLYDLVNNVFYTNAGTGSFIVGGDVN